MEYEQNTKELETNVPESEDIDDANIESFQPKKQNEKNKKNLSLRWSKRQPTKNELFEQFTELKSSFAISQNSILMMEKRITTLETDIAQLIEYINSKL
jgi:hypothetical protein